MVAKTGFLIETRVINMGVSLACAPASAGGAASRSRSRANCRRQSDLQIVEGRGQDRNARREVGLDLDETGAVVAAAGGDDAACELAVLDCPDKVLSGFGPDRDCRQGRNRSPRRES